MNSFLDFCCWVARADPELVAQSNRFDKMTVASNAIALLTLVLFSAFVWGVFFSAFEPVWIALPLALLIAIIIYQFDAAISASDWELAGVLRQGPPSPAYWIKLAFRISISVAFSYATALGATLALFDSAITDHMQAKRAERNSPLDREYAARKEELKARLLGPLQEEIRAATDARTYGADRVRRLRAKREELRERSSRAYIEAGREQDGLDRPWGRGPRYRDAVRQREQSDKLGSDAAAEIERATAELQALDAKLGKLNEQLAVRNGELAAGWQALEREKTRDPRWVPERDGALTRYLALCELEKDSEYGAAITRLERLSMLVLITIELMFLIIKVGLAPASVYVVRLIARTKAEAAQVSAKFAQELQTIRDQHPRAAMQIIDQAPATATQAGDTRQGDPEPSQQRPATPAENEPEASSSAETPAPDSGAATQPGDAAAGPVPVIGSKPARQVNFDEAVFNDAAYYVDRGTRTVYDRRYWEELQARVHEVDAARKEAA